MLQVNLDYASLKTEYQTAKIRLEKDIDKLKEQLVSWFLFWSRTSSIIVNQSLVSDLHVVYTL